MNVLITGTSYGIGEAVASEFTNRGHDVIGLDIMPMSEKLQNDPHYIQHIICNVADASSLPDIDGDIHILINNAGVWNTDRDIDVNLKGTINCTEKYALNNPSIVSVLNQSASCATTGSDMPEYVASKGGIVAYTKWAAKELAAYGATCNSLSFGGVRSDINKAVMDNDIAWQKIMAQTPLRKWASLKEVAEWTYFLTAINRSCSGQDIVVDNLESLNNQFIWI